MTQPSFADYNLPDELTIILQKKGFDIPTPVQQKVIPLARENKDLIVSAATGTGKTAAYLLPMLERFHDNPSHTTATRGLILVPTRELAKQIIHHFHQLGSMTRLTAAVITGGHPKKYQVADLRKNPDILIATPGRLLDHIENEHVDLSDLEILVLDEADRMLDMGFVSEVLMILESANPRRQSMLLSATLNHKNMQVITDHLLHDPITIAISPAREKHPDIHQQVILADDAPHKQKLLLWLAANEPFTKAVIFANMRETVKHLSDVLRGAGLRAGTLHGEMEQRNRNLMMDRFRRGEINLLVATDVAARGLDISDLDLVINYDMARNAEELLHRTGRTGRAGKSGIAISLITAPDWNRMASIERYLQLDFEQRKISGLEGNYKGPKKQKSSGKAAGSKKILPEKKKQTAKVKQRLRDKKNIGKRRKPSATQAEPTGTGALKRRT